MDEYGCGKPRQSAYFAWVSLGRVNYLKFVDTCHKVVIIRERKTLSYFLSLFLWEEIYDPTGLAYVTQEGNY